MFQEVEAQQRAATAQHPFAKFAPLTRVRSVLHVAIRSRSTHSLRVKRDHSTVTHSRRCNLSPSSVCI
jgi:hypothetical protein